MKNSLAAFAVAGLVGAIVAIVAASSGLVRFAGSGSTKKYAAATIYVESFGGGCRVTTVPQTLEVFKREIAEWTVVNRCPENATDDVKVVFDPLKDPHDKLDKDCVLTDKKRLKCKIDKDAVVNQTYKYTVIAGDFREDPDLEIAP
jgi:hypothetical protein